MFLLYSTKIRSCYLTKTIFVILHSPISLSTFMYSSKRIPYATLDPVEYVRLGKTSISAILSMSINQDSYTKRHKSNRQLNSTIQRCFAPSTSMLLYQYHLFLCAIEKVISMVQCADIICSIVKTIFSIEGHVCTEIYKRAQTHSQCLHK